MKASKSRIISDEDYIKTLQATKRAVDKITFALGMLFILAAILILTYANG